MGNSSTNSRNQNKEFQETKDSPNKTTSQSPSSDVDDQKNNSNEKKIKRETIKKEKKERELYLIHLEKHNSEQSSKLFLKFPSLIFSIISDHLNLVDLRSFILTSKVIKEKLYSYPPRLKKQSKHKIIFKFFFSQKDLTEKSTFTTVLNVEK